MSLIHIAETAIGVLIALVGFFGFCKAMDLIEMRQDRRRRAKENARRQREGRVID